MSRSPQEIIDQAAVKHNPNTEGNGMLTRDDIKEVLDQLPDDISPQKGLSDWLLLVPFLTVDQKHKILDDIKSYGH
mgnify:CR=1 FL=1